jgi:Fic family protein
LRDPLLYLSLFFKQNRQTYYEHLQAVREHGEWAAVLILPLEAPMSSALCHCELHTGRRPTRRE